MGVGTNGLARISTTRGRLEALPDESARRIRYLAVLFVCVLAAGTSSCSAKRPVLYPDLHYQRMGKTRAEQDIDACLRLGRSAGLEENRASRVAKEAGTGAAVGGAAGGAYGMVRGDAGKRAAGGAAAGAAAGTVRGTLRSGDPDPILRRYVERCLRDKGYDVIGWR